MEVWRYEGMKGMEFIIPIIPSYPHTLHAWVLLSLPLLPGLGF